MEERVFDIEAAGVPVVRADGKHEQALSPMQLLAAALATCSGITMVELLAKMRQPFLSLEVVSSGERSPEPPRPWTRLHLTYRLEGAVDVERAERAAFLSETKHCPVSLMLLDHVEITHAVERVGPDVRRIRAEETRSLRRTLLRPHQSIGEMTYPGDGSADTVHFGGYLDRRLVGIASLYREARAGDPNERAWKLRGMATAPEARGQGIGGALLRTCLTYARICGAEVVWCSARAPAIGFYERYGFKTEGDYFEVPVIGTHVIMERLL